MRPYPLLTLLSLLVLGPLVGAAPTTVHGTWEGAGWVAFQTDMMGESKLEFEVEQDAHTATTLGISFTIPDGGSISTTLAMHGHATEISTSVGQVDVGVTLTGDSQPYRLRGTLISRNYSGPMQMIVWDAGARGAWHWNISSDGAWTEVGRGRDAYFWSGEEAAEGLHAKAAVEGNGVVVSNATYDLHVANRFWGFAGLANPSRVGEGSTITLTDPDGAVWECSCWTIHAPGDYRLDWRGIDVLPHGGMPILLAGVDVPTWVE